MCVIAKAEYRVFGSIRPYLRVGCYEIFSLRSLLFFCCGSGAHGGHYLGLSYADIVDERT